MTFARYVAVQIAAYALDMGAFLVLLHGGIAGPVPANVAAKIVAGGFAFFAHRAFTFRLGGTAQASEAARYAILLALNVPVASALLAALLLQVGTRELRQQGVLGCRGQIRFTGIVCAHERA